MAVRLLRKGLRPRRRRAPQPRRRRPADDAARPVARPPPASLPSNTCSPMLGGPMPRAHQLIVCVLVPRFPLRVALRGPLPDRPVALGPEPGGQPLIGEVNAVAAALGVQQGRGVGEAIARCPGLELVTADPGAVADAADALVRRLE